MALDDAAYPTIHRVSDQIGFPPEAILAVAYLESRFTPSIHTSGTSYYGLTQISAQWLKAHGIDPADFLTWPASRQIEQATGPFFVEQMRAVGVPARRTPGVLQALNLAPARVKDGDPSRVLYSKVVECPAKGDPYCSNRGTDINGDGRITIGDLDAFVAKLEQQAPMKEALQKLNAYSPSPSPPPAPLPSRSVTFADLVPAAIIVSGGLAAAAFYYKHETDRRRRP